MNHNMIVGLLLLLGSCTNLQQETMNSNKNNLEMGELYANEYGEIRLIEQSDTTMRVVFKNQVGETFDTIMSIVQNHKIIKNSPFLQLRYSGLELRKACLYVHEFSGLTYLAQFITIEQLYTRPFYKIGQKLSITGKIQFQKGGTVLDGIYLSDYGKSETYATVKGVIEKAPYPRAYYSTDESPQGKFTDDGEVHYRLIMKDYKVIKEFDYQVFKGKTVNLNGRAGFIWDFADSAVYYVEGKRKWSRSEVDKNVEIEAVLISEHGVSVLKDWTILNDDVEK